MGRAMKWLKGLFCMKKRTTETSSSCFRVRGNKKASSFGHSLRRVNSTGMICNPPTTPPNISVAEFAWMRNMSTLYGDDQEIHNQAMVVVSATMAVDEAAVKVAEATDELVKLTSRGREASAAITIQTIFRGFLARRELKTLKALVKIQAVARGFLIRKQIHATYRSMLALQRAHQRAIKARCAQFQSKKSQENFNDSRRIFKVASRRSKSFSTPLESNVTEFDTCIKPLEIDFEETTSRSRKIKKCDEAPRRNRARILFPGARSFDQSDQWGYIMRGDQTSPIYSSRSNLLIKPEKCEFWNGNENYSNYMVNTRSSNAKRLKVFQNKGLMNYRTTFNELTIESKSSCTRAQGNNVIKNI